MAAGGQVGPTVWTEHPAAAGGAGQACAGPVVEASGTAGYAEATGPAQAVATSASEVGNTSWLDNFDDL